jgi:HAD superfamily hydrolase (TIGR01490 family)
VRGASDEETALLRERVLESIAGVRVVDMSRLTPDILKGILPRVYPEMLRTAYAHQDAGRPAFIVTSASQELADLMAHVLVLDGGVGMQAEIEDGVYTGRLDGPVPYGEGKAEAVQAMAAERGVDLAESWAYSDSASDLPMLRAVGHAVAVNPDSELLRVAQEEGWEVVRFEKLGRRLRIAGAAAALAALGGGGGWLAPKVRAKRSGKGAGGTARRLARR